MKKKSFLEQIRAAQNMSIAFDHNKKFAAKDLDALGLPADFSNRFKK